jgi:hypothetical protein
LTIDTGGACGDRSGFAGVLATGLEKVLGLILLIVFGLAETGFDCAAAFIPLQIMIAGINAASASFDS